MTRCPECGSKSPKIGRSPSIFYDTRHVCPKCGCIFDIDREDVLDRGHTMFNCHIIANGAGPMAEVRQYVMKEHPEIRNIAEDPEVFRFITDYWNFVRWNEHGNECSYQELAEDGGFYFLMKDLSGDTDEGFLDYLNGNGCKELLRRRSSIRKRFMNRELDRRMNTKRRFTHDQS